MFQGIHFFWIALQKYTEKPGKSRISQKQHEAKNSPKFAWISQVGIKTHKPNIFGK